MDKQMLQQLRYRLNQYRVIVAKRRALEIRLKEVEQLIGLKGVGYDSVGGGSGISRTTENQAMKLIQAREELEFNIAHKGIEVDKIENALSVLDPGEREVIECKHIENHKWETVYYNVKKSDKTCKKLEREGLIKMMEILNY
ncbi:hypothetical protein [uncultured Clostridium sp.]|jgi:hypothetical protein|uniref:hypothetical protein n=1 Tax=uncultured Clostridium sp. TaxID=59620 RepID=UPI00262FC48B|nr:hypothetical protein [uncultured Clostridium sp.]